MQIEREEKMGESSSNNIKITDKKREAIRAFLVDHSDYSAAKIANEIGCDQSTMSRIITGKTRFMNGYTYSRLEYNFIGAYLPKSEIIKFNPDESIQPKIFHNKDLLQYKKENEELKKELKKYKSILKKMNKLMDVWRVNNDAR